MVGEGLAAEGVVVEEAGVVEGSRGYRTWSEVFMGVRVCELSN